MLFELIFYTVILIQLSIYVYKWLLGFVTGKQSLLNASLQNQELITLFLRLGE